MDIVSIISKSTIEDDDRKDLEEHFLAVKIYLVNADHDVTDSICFFVYKKIQDTIDRYGASIISQQIHDFIPFRTKMKAANVTVCTTREERQCRNSDYTKLEQDYIPELLSMYEALNEAEELVLTYEKKARFWAKFVSYSAIIIATIATAIAIIGLPVVYDHVMRPLLHRIGM